MYKIISLLIFLLFLSQTFSFAANANMNFDLEEEEYVNDIPFSTSDIITFDLDTNRDTNFSEPSFELRQKMIVVNRLMNVNFNLEDEEYIDDIPFDTESISDSYTVHLDAIFYEGMKVEFQLEDELYIDDIPFNTSDVVRGLRP